MSAALRCDICRLLSEHTIGWKSIEDRTPWAIHDFGTLPITDVCHECWAVMVAAGKDAVSRRTPDDPGQQH